MELPRTLRDFEAAAADRLADPVWGYIAGGAGDERTLRLNEEAWARIGLRQRILVDVSRRDLTATILGRARPTPLVVAPMAYQRMAAAAGELATVRGAAEAGAVFCLSTLTTTPLEEVAAAAPGAARWYQVYVLRDRGLTREQINRARESGYEALVVTGDVPVFGSRDRDARSGFSFSATLVDAAVAEGARGGFSPATGAELIDPALTWRDLEWLAAEGRLPLLVKGVLTREDARAAAESGCAGIVVSNHGGRQLDGVAATADALPAVVDEVGGRLDVLVDGGIRRGTDVLKALALGAGGVLVGRPVMWGLAAGGEEGVRAVLELLASELDTALALAGATRVADVGPALLDSPS